MLNLFSNGRFKMILRENLKYDESKSIERKGPGTHASDEMCEKR